MICSVGDRQPAGQHTDRPAARRSVRLEKAQAGCLSRLLKFSLTFVVSDELCSDQH